MSDDLLASIMKKLQFKTVNAFYAAIGDGSLDIAGMKDLIAGASEGPQADNEGQHEAGKASENEQARKKLQSEKNSSDDILVIDARNLKNLDYKMAKCCNPVYGDDVFGFVSIKDGIKIHRISCPNAARLMEMYPYRIQKVRWSDSPSTSSFQTTLKITAAHEPSVINEVMDIVNTFRASIRTFNVTENGRNGTYEISVKLSVPSNLELDKVLSRLRTSRNILKVTRA